MRVAMIGTGYVGLVSGACFADFGHEVTCIDKDAAKIERLQCGRMPIYEPGLETLVARNVEAGRLTFSTEYGDAVREADAVFIAVGTPSRRGDGHADLSYVHAAAEEVAPLMDGFTVVVTKSTVPVGTGDEIEQIIRGKRPDAQFAVVSNPEFLREGAAINDFKRPDRVVVGIEDDRARDVMRELYRPLFLNETPMLFVGRRTSELIKYAANAFLATKISLANEVANICERVGADIKEVVRGVGLDSRIGPKFLNAGVGWGGSCFGKDVSALIDIAKEYGYEPSLLYSTVDVNKRQRHVPVQKLQEALKIIKGKTIGLLGLAFKPNTDDLRDAPAIEIASELIEMGARVKAYDPIANDVCRRQHPELKIEYAADALALAEDCDALVVITEWEEFRYLDLNQIGEVMNSKVLIDGRNLLDPRAVEEAGFKYRGIGR